VSGQDTPLKRKSPAGLGSELNCFMENPVGSRMNTENEREEKSRENTHQKKGGKKEWEEKEAGKGSVSEKKTGLKSTSYCTALGRQQSWACSSPVSNRSSC